tara:strand:- start:384 stop:503 length:120 start_codon:yes stop_codon:yes gene_type:complete
VAVAQVALLLLHLMVLADQVVVVVEMVMDVVQELETLLQ